tara:strand:- start:318 stop:698 length:381 start_codon:yes stop_codon:yes gene_type:complete
MRTINTVFKRLAQEDDKTELASQKIELSLFEDLKKWEALMWKSQKETTSDAERVEKEFQKTKKANKAKFDDAYTLYKRALKELREAESMAKNLGLKVPKEWANTLEGMRTAINRIPLSDLRKVWTN